MIGRSLKTLTTGSYQNEVKERIREAIITGELQPGQRIVETKLARIFGTSQVPVREALRGLEEEGLVRSVLYKGTYVADFVLKEIYHIFLLRTQIEMTVLELVLPTLTEEHIGQLEVIVEQMRNVEGDADYLVQSELDVRFHGRILEWSQVETYVRIWHMLSGHVRRFISLMHPTYFTENHDTVVRQHEELIAVLKSRNFAQVKEAFTDHVMLLWRENGEAWLTGGDT
ncbi:GntR family transcriptional regulator [Alicyclobacillus dauci]|uniref:GntR family transcriptional regulator n=1 Tax=Alicyclobacillus dauci TaxID=1475485 RepID=A0ABY6Z1N2_9BACL|nr:GntR family transcriptional regulator [Alicyclobacillus dauci]WAH36736.1 GntR family transcriptional regulator [Alicyclobacillus dauci]